jgi:hypothetical protein
VPKGKDHVNAPEKIRAKILSPFRGAKQHLPDIPFRQSTDLVHGGKRDAAGEHNNDFSTQVHSQPGPIFERSSAEKLSECAQDSRVSGEDLFADEYQRRTRPQKGLC